MHEHDHSNISIPTPTQSAKIRKNETENFPTKKKLLTLQRERKIINHLHKLLYDIHFNVDLFPASKTSRKVWIYKNKNVFDFQLNDNTQNDFFFLFND